MTQERILVRFHVLVYYTTPDEFEWRQGKYAEAEEMIRRALVGSERVLGVEHSDTLTSVCYLAAIL
jgi:hypothetical protein